ncbi:MAG TPA: protease HtpX [Accumulibacter sp.]|uniref:protease HtpX n=3 Tax=Accumulibacter sp. TaxID=2053492 RepID=UPI0026245514|nr:protease HtpX [Accumulibacter sp.]MDS4053569.1 protease HtpX [Accumulibacter sp.]HMV05433.1 protease HtpX [Accumulibacter sp.]HMW62799.1 protease HtpX [Accumulibacter sp.]HMW79675.1 protease HtpX [Accumulibacter sp.]HNB67399.1 protease HtpX [Accumulibacter sp.]
MKRVFLLIATNLAIMLVLGVVSTLTGAHRFFSGAGLDLGKLLFFALIMGFGGSFISLWMSKTIAKWSTGAQVIETPANSTEFWLVDTVRRFSEKAGLPMPEVAIYEGEPNAFATGASRNSSMVAVSTGLLQSMTRSEAEAVIAHEVAHIANGDMVTLTLIQGVVNTFVIFLARVVGWVVDSAMRRGSEESAGPGIGYTITVVICDIVFGILASIIVMYFSRVREFRADAGAAQLLGTPQPMVAALQRLGGLSAGELPQNVATAGITGGAGWMALFSSHPPIEERIAALQNAR